MSSIPSSSPAQPNLLNSALPTVSDSGAAPGNLGQPAKVKAGEDYYYYYYYYDDEYPEDGAVPVEDAASASAAATA